VVNDSRLASPGPASTSTVAALFHDHHGEHSQPQDPLPYVRAAVLNGCRSVLRRRGIARRAALIHRASQQPDEALASAESEVILSEDPARCLAALAGDLGETS
jgi:hypothetical protein